MSYEPSLAATLLRRRNTGSAGPDLYNLTEYYYEPATRNSNAYLTQSSDPTEFTLPATTIVDRYCLAPGVAPYTEARVHRTGAQGAIATDYVDNVTSCQITCTLGVTLTAGPVHNGRATLTATLSGASGAVLLSLDGFQTPGTPPDTTTTATFLDARPGTYTVSVRETRPNGCTATASVTFTAPYGPRYSVTFKDIDSTDCLLQVFEREYSGAVEELTAQQNPVTLDWPGGATDHLFTQLLNGSQAQLALYLTRDNQLLPLFSGDERLHRADYYRAGALLWTGYILPEQYEVALLTPPTTFNLSASDGLGTLNTVHFTGSAGEALRGDWTALQVILYCLGKLDLALPLHTLFNLFPASAVPGQPALSQFAVDVEAYQDEKGLAWDCGKVLSALLTPFAARLYQQEGAWWLERLSELTGAATTYQTFAPDGTRGADITITRLVSVQPPASRPCWLNGSQHQSLRPAVARVQVTANPGELLNRLRLALPKNSDLPAAYPVNWTGASSTPDVPWSELLYAGKDKTPTLRLFGKAGPANGYANDAAQLANALRQPWVQLPVLPPVPFPYTQGSTAHSGEKLILRFTAKPYGNTPETLTGKVSFLSVAVKYGDLWLPANVTNGVETATAQAIVGAEFPTTATIDAEVVFGASAQPGPHPLQIRIYAPVGGATATTVDISDLTLTYQNGEAQTDDGYTSRYTGKTGQLVSREDTGTELFHSDVPHQRLAGTWLDRERLPVQGWQEPATPGQVREVGDFLVRDRLSWQYAPAQTLVGTLRGFVPGPGCLLTDPSELQPAVYVLTSYQHHAADAEGDLTGVQALPLLAPGAALPDFAIYFDDNTAWQEESGRILVYENA